MRRLFKYILKEIPFYIFGFFSLIVIDYLQLLIPQKIGEAVDVLKINTPSFMVLLNKIFTIFLITVLVTIGRFFWRIFILGASRRIEYNIRNDLFWHLESLSMNFFTQNKTGDLMAYFSNDIPAIRMLISRGVTMSFDAVIMIGMIISKTIKDIDFSLTILALLPLPLISVGALFFSKVIQHRFREKQEAFAKLTDFVQETISGIRVIKAFVKEEIENISYFKWNKENFDKNLKLAQTFSLLYPMIGLIVGLSLAITLIYGSYLTITSTITLGSFIAFIKYIDLLIWPMIALGWSINIFSQGIASQKRIDKLFDIKPEITDRDADFNIKEIIPEIKIENLTFKYPNTDKIVLNNISITVKKGESLGIIGKIGSGKTTLANLLVRLYDPPEKTIYISGFDIKKIPLKLLREKIGYVTQDTILFSDTVKQNVALALNNINEQEIIEVCKRSVIHDNILEFPDKYNTIIGERGINLSGGQKQRLALARALIINNEILIIDDALSAVDTKTEEEILKNIKEVRKDKTTIIISHRISVVNSLDKVAVLDNGNLIEYGSPFELLKKNGFYAKLYKKQMLEDELEKLNL